MCEWLDLKQVRNYDLNGVSHFLNSFEFSSQKWIDFYKWQDEQKQKQTQVVFFLIVTIHRNQKTSNALPICVLELKPSFMLMQSVEIL